MIIYSRSLSADKKVVSQLLEDYRAELNFLPWLHDRRNPRFLSLLKKRWFRSFLADVGAAAIGQMVYRHHIGPKSGVGGEDPNWKPLANHLSELFDQRVQSLGYHKGRNAAAWREDHAGKVLLIVAGCQKEPMYKRRARAAVRFVSEADLVGSHIVFSGANPTLLRQRLTGPADQAHTTLEAAALHEVFDAELPRRAAKRLNLRCTEETESANTKENIANSFRKLGKALNEYQHLVVISSLFHVPRLAIEVERMLAETEYRFSSLALIGSELPYNATTSRTGIKWHRNYFRSACFEALNLLFDHPDTDKLVEPPRR